MRKRIVTAVVILALALGSAVWVSAQGGVTYTSGFQVQNLEADQATVQLQFYSQDGTLVASPTYTIAGNSSRTFFPISDVPSGFNGSLVISSDRNIRAINNLLGSGVGDYFASTNGFQGGATEVNLPLIMCNNSGFDTWFNVQNTGSADATVTINYIPGSNGNPRSETAVIKPGAAKTFSQAIGSPTVNCSTLADGSGRFIGSAKISATQPIVAVVMQINTSNFKVLMGYGGFTSGSPTVALPLIMANNNGFYTGIQVQNVGSSSTNVTVDYTANTVGAGNPADEVFNLAPGASKTIIQNGAPPANGSAVNDWNAIGRYIGGAIITNDANQPLVAIVNQVRPGSSALGSAYEGFNPASATTKVSAPLIMANNNTYFTGIQVQNVSSSDVTVTIDYGPNTAGSFDPANEVFTLPAGASKTIIQNGAPPANGSAVNNWGTNRYIGSATITATGNIVAIVNQLSLSRPGDQFATTDAFNY
ncbi:MAG: hypothetical protein RML36_10280 [Anaerolineae bacterium]|nr:hypothetical protein [Anaerolineae bacterium]MDW8099853.1 hypothetical protein [Anaerolineae bacterium]